jgi:hypothetical protein
MLPPLEDVLIGGLAAVVHGSPLPRQTTEAIRRRV